MNYNSILNLHKSTTKPWTKKKLTLPPHRSPLSLLLFSLFTLLFIVFLLISFHKTTPYSLLSRTQNSHFSQCSRFQALTLGEKFLWYAPHSGFSNQLSEFKNGILMAAILNRTLIVPPVLNHHAVALGSCPKFRVLEPKEVRASVWDHIVELIKTGRLACFVNICMQTGLLISGIMVFSFSLMGIC